MADFIIPANTSPGLQASKRLRGPIHAERHVDIICVGAGASGLLMAYKLQRHFRNYTLTVFEKNPEVSGTWFENTYPGYVNHQKMVAYWLKLSGVAVRVIFPLIITPGVLSQNLTGLVYTQAARRYTLISTHSLRSTISRTISKLNIKLLARTGIIILKDMMSRFETSRGP